MTSTPAMAQDSSPCCGSDLTEILTNPPPIPTVPLDSDCGGVCVPTPLGSGEYAQICDLTARLGSATPVSAQAVAVHDSLGNLCRKVGGGYASFCSFGVDATGANYYCAWDTTHSGDALVEVQLNGGDANDILQFWWDQGGNKYNLDAYSGFTGTFYGRMSGMGGSDELQGSRSSLDTLSAFYQDVLAGGHGDDFECGLTGDDAMNGGLGVDLVCGDDGDDSLAGTGGRDILCGYADFNTLEGGAGNDYLDYGSSGTNDGGPDSDQCTNGTGDVNCESVLLSDECPT